MCFRSQAEPGKVSQCSALQLVETDAGKGLCAMEMMLCVALLFIVHVTLVVPALTKTNTWRNFFFFACSSERVKGKNPTSNTSCYSLHHLELQWISAYFSPKGLVLIILFLKNPLLQSLGSSLVEHECVHKTQEPGTFMLQDKGGSESRFSYKNHKYDCFYR